MRRAFAWLAGGLGLAALLRSRRREQAAPAPAVDPAAALREKLQQARAVDDRDEFDAAEGQPVELAEPAGAERAGAEQPLSLEERRRAIHEKAQQALGEMQDPDETA